MHTALPPHAPTSPGRVLLPALLISVLLHLVLLYCTAGSRPDRGPIRAEPAGYRIQLQQLPAPSTARAPHHGERSAAAPQAHHSRAKTPPIAPPGTGVAHVRQARPAASAHQTLPTMPAKRQNSEAPPPRLSMQSLLDQASEMGSEPQPAANHTGRLLYGSSAKGPVWSQYMDDWVYKMQRIGELNYPEEVRRQGLTGGPTLSVEINADGSLRNVRIYRSSGNATLDNAAISLVRSATPFSPFPPSLAQLARSVEIRRKWSFSTGKDLSVH
jgi:protein TonB